MKTQIIRHGEVLLVPSELPKGAELKETVKKKIVAHSETGHHHILEAQNPFRIYSWNGETYVEVPELAKLWHQKTGKEAHKTHSVVPAIYKIVIKKHFDYFAKKMTEVRD